MAGQNHGRGCGGGGAGRGAQAAAPVPGSGAAASAGSVSAGGRRERGIRALKHLPALQLRGAQTLPLFSLSLSYVHNFFPVYEKI